MDSKYCEQAYEHLMTALKLNSVLLGTSTQAKQYHPHILTLLGRCSSESGYSDDALELFDMALKMNRASQGDNHPSNWPIFTAIARVYVNKKLFDDAIHCLSTASCLGDHVGLGAVAS